MMDRLVFSLSPGVMRGTPVEIVRDNEVVAVDVQTLRPGDELCLVDGTTALEQLLMFWAPYHYCIDFSTGVRIKTGPRQLFCGPAQRLMRVDELRAGAVVRREGESVTVTSIRDVGTGAPVYHLNTLAPMTRIRVRGIALAMPQTDSLRHVCLRNPVESRNRVRLPAGFGEV